ncbi:MAG: response regulator transcription factor [Verrucomicrobia subdivision 3 bacterium]|nr:response regulator transcription factor [Limisphaerales bacterium]
MTKKFQITVLLVDDHSIVREGLRGLLEAGGDIKVVGEAADGNAAIKMARNLRPKVVLMDVAMPGLHGLEAARQMVAEAPESRVLILSSYSDPLEVSRALEAGAAGYVMKETASLEVLQAVRDASHGKPFFSAEISRRMTHHTRSAFERGTKPGNRGAPHLTPREEQVLKLVAEGKANKQIADEMSLSIKTVEKHRASLMQKLNIHERPASRDTQFPQA